MPPGVVGPSSSQSSASQMASTPRSATSTNGPMGSPTTQNQAITSAALLGMHSHRSNPALAALEQAVSERNSLCSQNAQLWKLIEKQRTGYAAILKELDRVRSERDSFKTKDNTDSLRGGENDGLRPQATRSQSSNDYTSFPERQLHSSRSQEPLQPSYTPSSSTSTLQYSSGAVPPVTPQRPPRQTPAPITVPQRADSTPSGPPTVVLLPASATATPLRPVRKNTGDMATPTRDATDVYATPARPQPKPASSHPSAPNGAASASLMPIVPPSRTTSNPLHTLVEQPSPISAVRTSPQALTHSPEPDRLTVQASSSRDSRVSLPVEAKRYIQSMGESPQVSPGPSPMTQSFAADSGAVSAKEAYDHAHATAKPVVGSFANWTPPPLNGAPRQVEAVGKLRRDSVSSNSSRSRSESPLRQSAARVEMDERSPPVTPMASAYARSRSPQTPRSFGEAAALDRDAAERESERVELEKEAEHIRAKPKDPEKERVRLDKIKAAKERNAREKLETRAREAREATATDQREGGYESSISESEFLDVDEGSSSSNSNSNSKARTEDFPLPPSGGPSYAPSTASATEYASSMNGDSMYPPSSGSTIVDQSQQQQYPVQQQQSQQASGIPGAFRALPLIPEDLPYTSIQVSHSSIRPNDRGKEVLSFIVRVEPGNSKEGWQVEKLYADVIGLDMRVRASLGKSVIKKMANLPEGKLWKDHAPAKVDQRKVALEGYLQNLISLPVKDKNEVIAFFTSDIVREAKRPVMQAGYKEGYLTKRGKNFGGWKTRYFVLHGPVLEYYESRGGTHLGSITINGAQIGRQQRGEKRESDEEKEYRHAFLVVEAKRGPGGNHPRHVLCAESDADRDSWVEMLVRYVNGSYSEEASSSFGPSPINTNNMQNNDNGANAPPRSSSSSIAPYDYHTAQYDLPQQSSQRTPSRGTSKDDFSSLQVVPESMDPSLVDRTSPGGYSDGQNARRLLERGQSGDAPLSSSLPSAASPLETANTGLAALGQRSNSEMGYYPDLTQVGRPPPALSPNRPTNAKTYQPVLNAVASSPMTPSAAHLTPTSATQPDRDPSPDPSVTDGKAKISRPIGGVPIPSGFKFGGGNPPPVEPPVISSNDRREKAKSRSFWGFGRDKNASEKPQMPPVTFMSRAVFGVALEESLDVAQIANLPAIVFRSIQYLEAKQADQEEGIYRLSGSSAVIKALKDRFNQEGDVDLLGSDEYWDMHAIAGLLKSFLRELPASILTRDLHLRFLAVIADFAEPQDRIDELARLVSALPLANYTILRALTAHLILIVQNAGTNKMTMRNVGIVFSPTLGIPAGVFSLMLGEFNQVFNVDGKAEEDEDEPAVGEDETVGDASSQARPTASGLSRANSHRYSATAADELLGLKGRALSVAHTEDVPDDSSGEGCSVESEGDEVTIDEQPSTPPLDPRRASGATSSTDDNHTTPHSSKASLAAADRGLGLNLATNNRGNRHSRMLPKGLPMSPRPGQAFSPPSAVPASPP